MPTSKADRLSKLFQGEEPPPLPDPNQPHIADTELLSSAQPTQQPWKVPKVAQQPRVVQQSPPRTGQDIDQLTSSDDDEYIRSFKKTPAARTASKKQPQNEARKPSSKRDQGAPQAKSRPEATGDGVGNERRQSEDDGNPLLGRFCPLLLVTKFCYKYMDDPDDRVSRHFFASGKIWNRGWDIHFLHPPSSMFAKPILLVPEAQVQLLLDEIEMAFKVSIPIPPDPFLLSFRQDGTPAPILLGTARGREEVAEMERTIPKASADHGECPAGASLELQTSFERFREMTERAIGAGKRKAVAKKKTRAKDRLMVHANPIETLRRGQRHLGLRPSDRKGRWPTPDTFLSWQEQQKLERAQKIQYGHILPPLDVHKPSPCVFDNNVVFVAIDIEAFETNHKLVTEVGISTLDTLDIRAPPPGHCGFNWMQCIRSRHFRIRENAHLRNTRFCVGNPDRFLFGRSEVVGINEVGKIIDSCFQPPYSSGFVFVEKSAAGNNTFCNAPAKGQSEDLSLKQQASQRDDPAGPLSTGPVDPRDPTNVEQELATRVASSNLVSPCEGGAGAKVDGLDSERPISKATSLEHEPKPASPRIDVDRRQSRNVILVGHDLDSDLAYLSTLGSAIFSTPPTATYPQPLEPEHPLRKHVLESFDTARLYKAWKGESNLTSLAKALVGFERTGWGLHNGGNDARYTMEVLVGLLVQSRLEEGEKDVEPADGPARAGEGLTPDSAVNGTPEVFERDEREKRTMCKDAVGGERREEHEVLPDPFVPASGLEGDDAGQSSVLPTGNR